MWSSTRSARESVEIHSPSSNSVALPLAAQTPLGVV
jgi:hypothetical protein